MKKKVLITSVATIALCFCLIVGSTFALFTDTKVTNISVTAGNVKMDAFVDVAKVESVLPNNNGTIEDEYGAKYSYDYKDTTEPFVFVNGGTAGFEGAVLVFNDITPGDKVTFTISGENNSDVSILCRYRIEYYVDNEVAATTGLTYTEDLMKELVFTVNGGTEITNMKSYVSPWTLLAVGDDMTDVTVTMELPVDVGNELQDKNSMIRVLVEAVQSNANVETNTNPVITPYS